MKERILVTLAQTRDSERYLGSKLTKADLRCAASEQIKDDDLSWANIVFGNIAPAHRLSRHPNVTWLHTPNVGLEMYESLARESPHLTITHSRGVMDNAVADHGLAMLLALTRNLPLLILGQSQKQWVRQAFMTPATSITLAGKVAHVLGYGPIAKAMITRLNAFSMSTTVYRRQAIGEDPLVVRFLSLDMLEEHVREADVLVGLLPEKLETRGIISGSVLNNMKPTALLVNLGRGSAVDEQALADALRERRLAGAALDVFQTEPLSSDSPLWDLTNVLISPHVGGRYDAEVYAHIDQFLQLLRERAENGNSSPRQRSEPVV